jgi:hypothetical protein
MNETPPDCAGDTRLHPQPALLAHDGAVAVKGDGQDVAARDCV